VFGTSESLWLNRNLLEGTLSSELYQLSKLGEFIWCTCHEYIMCSSKWHFLLFSSYYNVEHLYVEENLFTGTIMDNFLDFDHLGKSYANQY